MDNPRRSSRKDIKNVLNTSDNTEDESISESCARKYQDDSDYDEAFKNLLRPIESIAKKSHIEPLQHDLLKELDSYLNHLKESSDGGSTVFVEAALMFQNVILIYQKKVDHLIDVMAKLIGKFRAFRINGTEINNAGDDVENVEGNKKKKKEKKIKFYPSFDPIKGQIFGTLKHFDCKIINLSKRPAVPKVVLNANIKVENKYNQILPYIFVGNGENIGKKYDFMISYPLNRDLAINEEFDCPTKEDKCISSLKYQDNTDQFQMNAMDVDGSNSDDVLPSTPDPVIFDQTVNDEVCVANAMAAPDPPNILNVSQIPPKTDDDTWAPVLNNKETNYSDKPLIKKKVPKNEDTGVWLPTYTVAELQTQLIRLKSGLSVDHLFRKLVRQAHDIQRPEIVEKRNKRIAEEKKLFDYHDEEMDRRLINGEEPGFKGFECFDGPVEIDENIFDNTNEPEQPASMPEEDFETYKKQLATHDENQKKMMNDQLEMVQRVQIWHENLRPILEEEEKRTAFDIHEYGTRILNCFQAKGEQKSFTDLVGGQEQEEVARFFLSTLMMANTFNLKIINPSDDPDSEIKIELLKKERHHEELQVNIGNQINQEN